MPREFELYFPANLVLSEDIWRNLLLFTDVINSSRRLLIDNIQTMKNNMHIDWVLNSQLNAVIIFRNYVPFLRTFLKSH